MLSTSSDERLWPALQDCCIMLSGIGVRLAEPTRANGIRWNSVPPNMQLTKPAQAAELRS
jgi:hypothetical protein